MRQRHFEESHRPEWRVLEQQLDRLEQRRNRKQVDDDQLADLPERYRRLCHQQALATERAYSVGLTRYLNQLMIRAHRQLYRESLAPGRQLREFIVHGFPRAVRQLWPWCLASFMLFTLSTTLTALMVHLHPDMVYSVLDDHTVHALEGMYAPGNHYLGRQRDSGDDLLMFGYYIFHNISIGFRTWAGGIFAGIGSLVVVLFNGAFLGAAASHLVTVGYSHNFFGFVVTHSALELTAIMIAGAGGMRMGWALVAPGPWRRLTALRMAATETLPLLYGVFLLLVGAAFIEAFWSSKTMIPAHIKFITGACLWTLVYAWLLLGGRQR